MLINKYLEEDVLTDGFKVERMLTANGITWAIGTASDGEFRAYPDQFHADKYGVICNVADNIAQLIDYCYTEPF